VERPGRVVRFARLTGLAAFLAGLRPAPPSAAFDLIAG
jgi:hypothetical protein